MLESKGEMIPPCGVPFSGKPIPATSAFSMAEIMDSNFLSWIPIAHIWRSSFPWCTLSKNPLTSISITMCRLLFCICFSAWARAFSTPRFGRKPLLVSQNFASQIGSITCRTHCWISLSIIVGIPRGRISPFPLGISLRLTACGWYQSNFLCTTWISSASLIFASSAIVLPSVPGVLLPAFFFRFLYANLIFSSVVIILMRFLNSRFARLFSYSLSNTDCIS